MNANATVVLVFLLYTFSDAVIEFILHLFGGYTLLDGIPENDRVFDSYFIHYTRLVIVGIIFFITGMIFVACCTICIINGW